jgi:SAM-dependent methyltransferase
MSEAQDAKSLAQRQFGAHAAGYVSSPAHAKGYSLDRLIEFVAPAAGQRALDVATGGGHTALALAGCGPWTTAGDLTYPMLEAARQHIGEALSTADRAGSVVYAQLDAEHLPFAPGSYDAVTCRIAPHHFPDVMGFVRECARVVRPGGVVAVVDQLCPAEPKAATYVNNFERLRDPSHGWMYNGIEWQGFFSGAGLDVMHFEDFETEHLLTPWAKRMGCDRITITRLAAMLVQAPDPVAAWMKPEPQPNGDFSFVIRQFLLVGRKPE